MEGGLSGIVGQVVLMRKSEQLKEVAEECRRLIVELGLRPTVIRIDRSPELVPRQTPLRERGAFDGDGNPRRLPGDPAFLFWLMHHEALPSEQARLHTLASPRDNSYPDRFECLKEERFARYLVPDFDFDAVKHRFS